MYLSLSVLRNGKTSVHDLYFHSVHMGLQIAMRPIRAIYGLYFSYFNGESDILSLSLQET